MSDYKISIIIPLYNEEDALEKNLPVLKDRLKGKKHEIILVDGGSEDKTVQQAKNNVVQLIHSDKAQRAYQLNLGAHAAKGDIFYLLHADAMPPVNFDVHIQEALQNKFHFGLFAYRFQPTSYWLKLNAYFTQFDGLFTGGGDQSLFIFKSTFNELGGYDESMPIMEDFDFFHRAKKEFEFTIVPDRLIVSSRKYMEHSYLKVQLINMYVFLSYKLGRDIGVLSAQYRNWLG